VIKPDRIILANDEVATNEWEQELYQAAVPSEIEVYVTSVEDATELLSEEEHNGKRTIVLVDSPRDVLRLVRNGAQLEHLNVGGLHFREGTHQLLPFVYVDDDDLDAFRSLCREGVCVECQDVPTCHKIKMEKLLKCDLKNRKKSGKEMQ
jgi:mannose/fructose/N-acetylgalactosamine-specific phosphotransferase system component IIB